MGFDRDPERAGNLVRRQGVWGVKHPGDAARADEMVESLGDGLELLLGLLLRNLVVPLHLGLEVVAKLLPQRLALFLNPVDVRLPGVVIVRVPAADVTPHDLLHLGGAVVEQRRLLFLGFLLRQPL